MPTIGINYVIFTSALFRVETATNLINTDYAGWENQGECSDAFETYILGFVQLNQIMASYKQLVKKDIDSIKSIGKEILDVDEKLRNFWK